MQKNNGIFCLTHYSGEDIYLFTLRNIKGTEVSISNYGAIIMSFKVQDVNGGVNDIVLGFDKVDGYLSGEYLANYPYFGAAIGRYANRIKNGEFNVDGTKYLLKKNKITDHIHGGLNGFDKKVWQYHSGSEATLALKYKSMDGEEGYPGNLESTLSFELTDNNELIYEFTACTDKPTAVNLTHHSYFNLNSGYGTVNDHWVRINSSAILEQDDNFVVTGKAVPVDNTFYDFRQLKRIDEGWNADDGYDQSFILTESRLVDIPTGLNLAAEAFSQQSKLKLEVYTNEPVVHFYTGKWIPTLNGKNGNNYGPFSGLCFETHKHPNSINIPDFPNTILRPGEVYQSKTMYRIIS
ncbi:MAG: aldose epimerase family protein [Chitinophagaceae bacterium]